MNVKLSGILVVAESGVKLHCIAWTSCLGGQRLKEYGTLTKMTAVLKYVLYSVFSFYEGWNFNSGNYLFTTDTK